MMAELARHGVSSATPRGKFARPIIIRGAFGKFLAWHHNSTMR